MATIVELGVVFIVGSALLLMGVMPVMARVWVQELDEPEKP